MRAEKVKEYTPRQTDIRLKRAERQFGQSGGMTDEAWFEEYRRLLRVSERSSPQGEENATELLREMRTKRAIE